MAIKLEVNGYCHDCLDFTPDVEQGVRMYAGEDVAFQTDTVVRCANRNRCAGLVRYLEKETKG